MFSELDVGEAVSAAFRLTFHDEPTETMAEPLKELYSPSYVKELAVHIRTVHVDFPVRKFEKLVFDGAWKSRELKQRMRHLSNVMGETLPQDYRTAVGILMEVTRRFRVARPPSFVDMCFPDFVEVFGLDDFETSVRALELFTQSSSSEFAVRPFIVQYGEVMMGQMRTWSTHSNEHVRRLASEGCRPRLPWAISLPAFKKDPGPVLQILENLKSDPSEMVRRSVANNLNDISKDNPAVVLAVAKEWYGLSPATDRMLRHACRGLLKQGKPEALRLFGFRNDVPVRTIRISAKPSRLSLGQTVRVSFDLTLAGRTAHRLRLEYAVHFVKSTGRHGAKVFQIGERRLEPGSRCTITFRHAFRDLTTRRHYAGVHVIAILVNGQETGRTRLTLSI